MAKAYFIGGTPRVGKTTLTLRFIDKKPIMASSTDAIRYMLRRAIKELDEPDLFHLGKFTSNDPERRAYLKNNPMDAIIIQNNESAIVWKSVNNFVRSNLEDGFDVLIEGIAILPEFLDHVDYEYKSVFLGNQSEKHYQTILNTARNNDSDWMHGLEDETIDAFSTFSQTFSKYIEQETIKYGLTYIEIHENTFDSDIDLALDKLLN
jgi:2-phosphoglycerate kinase